MQGVRQKEKEPRQPGRSSHLLSYTAISVRPARRQRIKEDSGRHHLCGARVSGVLIRARRRCTVVAKQCKWAVRPTVFKTSVLTRACVVTSSSSRCLTASRVVAVASPSASSRGGRSVGAHAVQHRGGPAATCACRAATHASSTCVATRQPGTQRAGSVQAARVKKQGERRFN
jgi:hypothetical protein